MAISLSDHRDRKEANIKLPSPEFIKKYKWWLVAGLAIGLVAFLYYRNKGGAKASSATGTPNNSAEAGANAVDPNTGIPYATELAQAQGGSAAGSGGFSAIPVDTGSGSGSSQVTGTPSTSSITPTATAPATAPGGNTYNTYNYYPGTPPTAKQTVPVTRIPPPVKVTKPAKPATLLPVRTQPAIKKVGFPYPIPRGTVAV